MEAAQDMARLGYWTFDVPNQKPSWSNMMFEVLGRDPEQGVPNYARHREFIHPDDWKRFDDAVHGAIQGTPYDLELRVLFPDGTTHFVRARGHPSKGESGEIASLLGVAQDITEAKRREEALREKEALFRSTFEQAAVGMAQIDFEGNWIRVNERLYQLLGYSREELLDLEVSSVTHPDDLARFQKHFQRIIQGREEVESWRIRYLRKDGSHIWGQLTGSAVRDEEGEISHYLGIIIDISSQVEAEREVQESRTRLQFLNERLDQVREDEPARLSREIHDNLGQHLTAIRMDLDRIAAEHGDLSAEMERKIREVGTLVDQGIQIARNISSGLQSPVLELLGLVEAVRSTAEEASLRFGFDLHLDIPPGEPDLPKRKKRTLFTIEKEALANVSRHSRASEVWVGIRSDPVGLSMAVQDDGVGIPSQIRENPRSMGLLSMSERARSIGASFAVEPRGEGGTQVLVFLPTHGNP